MIFTCDNCGFIFSRSEETEQCPDCGKYDVRPADEAEQEEFDQRMAELIREECAEKPRFPDLVETEISMLNSFSFRLPATALQIDSQMIVDVIVEYGQSADDENGLTGNLWARPEGGRTTSFLMSVHLPAKADEAPREQVNRVFEALSGNGEFNARLADFIAQQPAQEVRNMDKAQKKAMIEEWKLRRPEMGVISIRCKETGEAFLGISKDTKADFNSNRAKLSSGNHPNKHLAALWEQYGPDAFEWSVLRVLDYEDPVADHTSELEKLREECLAADPQAVKIWK